MLADERIATGANQVPEHESDDDRVVELACDGNEVGHEVEGKDEVPQQADEQSLPPPRNPGITEQPVDEDDAVRDESSQCARLILSPEGEEDQDKSRPDEHEHSQDGARPDPPGQDG